MSSRAEASSSVRLMTEPMRWMIAATIGFVLFAGIQLFVLTEETDRFFAWTIGLPLTAAFLSTGYLASIVLESLVVREKIWANARTSVLGVWVFATLTMIATLMHLDAFHTDSFFGWAWFVVYAAVPLVMGATMVQQWRTPGGDPPRTRPMDLWARALLAGQAGVMVLLGIGLFIAPGSFDGLWPWSLTELTARATAAWLIGIGAVVGQAPWENDWRRVRAAMTGLLSWGLWILIVLARYSDTPDWDTAQAWLFLAFVFSLVGVTGYGTLRSWRLNPLDEPAEVAPARAAA